MSESINHRCAICGSVSTLGTNLCWRCTDGLSAFQRDVARLRRAVVYLGGANVAPKRIRVVRDGEVIHTVDAAHLYKN